MVRCVGGRLEETLCDPLGMDSERKGRPQQGFCYKAEDEPWETDLENPRRGVDPTTYLLGGRHSHSLNKPKPNFNNVNNSMYNYLGLMIWASPKAL